ncbi:MAG: glucuronate isomerase [Candidatus Borkfalkiaceae bacterium]|nr:glucuronate isomerase [Eubacteriales bacterium]MDY5820046.1 glucuronate isomerase [Christensenellaceae bacterium]
MSYIKDDFLLENKTAVRLYNDYAKNMPIFDYHCHLSEKQILENKRFNDVCEVWLGGDHYKWRLMRNFGVSENLITGDASNHDKFVAYCKTLATAFGNPLYHWSQLELKEFFNCELEINEENAETIWNWCNDYIALNDITPQKLIEQSNVKHIFTTNEVFDDLSTFEEIKKKGYKFTVTPAFRADKMMNIEAEKYNDFIAILESKTKKINTFGDFEAAIADRLEEFIKVGTVASDIAVERVCEVPERRVAEEAFDERRKGKTLTQVQVDAFKGYMTYYLMKLYASRNIRTELHVGAMRNNNSAMLAKLGLDTGFDSISEDNSIRNTSRLFDKLNDENALPRTIIFNLNPKMNAEIMTLIGCFQSDEARGKIQYGPAWWFLDNKVGMYKHLDDLTATGHLGAFVGMLTDSRSFLSYPRHHYFRRILCNYLGRMMENGEMTNNEKLVGEVIKDLSYRNAVKYFGIE